MPDLATRRGGMVSPVGRAIRFGGIVTWIRVETNMGENDKVMALATACGISTESCIGFLIQLWGQVAEHRPDGDLSGMTDDHIERWARWHGMPNVFAPHFRNLMMDNDLIVGWIHRQGKLALRAAADRLRKFHGSSTEKVTLRERDVTEVHNNSSSESSNPPDGLTNQLHREAWANLYRASQNPTAWAGALQAIATGMHPPSYPWPIIGQALVDMSANGSQPNVAALRGYCRKLTDPPKNGGKRDQTHAEQIDELIRQEEANRG